MPSPELGGEYEAARVHHASRRYGRGVAVCGALPTLAARPATSMIPIVFEVGDDPIKAGVSLANQGRALLLHQERFALGASNLGI